LTRLAGNLDLRPTNRLSLSAQLSHESLSDALQYVTTSEAAPEPRWIVGRIDQNTWIVTLRANLSLTPELTVQYYGSPFISTGRFGEFKRVTDSLAARYDERFHPFTDGELRYDPAAGQYRVSDADGSGFAFPNPDFSFRQFRSNLVVRWEYRPGSALYAVWSQGRTGSEPAWQPAFSSNWDALWSLRADDVFLVKLSYWFSP
jgi:hypothetical protein